MANASLTSPQALGKFLRSRREQLLPEQVGLTRLGRRRTPGLRREEVAQLSFVSTTWYTWLEQGRDIAVSARSLSNIALALQLSEAERDYLFTLAELSDPLAKSPPVQDDSIFTIVHQMQVPCYLMDVAWQLLAWNKASQQLFTGWLESDPSPNMLDFMFTHPLARQLVVDWPERAKRLVAELRAESIHFATHGPLIEQIETLSRTSVEFLECWQQQQVIQREGGVRSFLHAERGLLHFQQISWQLTQDNGIKMVTLLPVDVVAEKAEAIKI